MMKNGRLFYGIFALGLASTLLGACGKHRDNPGSTDQPQQGGQAPALVNLYRVDSPFYSQVKDFQPIGDQSLLILEKIAESSNVQEPRTQLSFVNLQTNQRTAIPAPQSCGRFSSMSNPVAGRVVVAIEDAEESHWKRGLGFERDGDRDHDHDRDFDRDHRRPDPREPREPRIPSLPREPRGNGGGNDNNADIAQVGVTLSLFDPTTLSLTGEIRFQDFATLNPNDMSRREPIYNRQGQVIDYQDPRDVTSTITQYHGTCSPTQVRQLQDGSTLLLIFSDGSLKLVKYDPSGRPLFQTLLLPQNKDSFPVCGERYLLEVNEFGSAFVGITAKEADFAAIRVHHRADLRFADGARLAPVVFQVDPNGQVRNVLTAWPNNPVVSLKALAVSGNQVWAGGDFRDEYDRSKIYLQSFIFPEQQPWGVPVASGPGFHRKISAQHDNLKGLSILPNGELLLTGQSGYEQVPTGSVTVPGDAFAAQVGPDGSLRWQQFGKTSRSDSFGVSRITDRHRLLIEGFMNGPITHDSGDQRQSEAGIWEVYFGPPGFQLTHSPTSPQQP